MPDNAHLDSILPHGEMPLSLLLLLRPSRGLTLCQPSSDRTSLLRSKIERKVLLLFVEETELGALVGIDHCEYSGNGFAEVVAVCIVPISDLISQQQYSIP